MVPEGKLSKPFQTLGLYFFCSHEEFHGKCETAHLIWKISMKNVKFQCFQQGFADSSCMENSLKDMHAIKGSI